MMAKSRCTPVEDGWSSQKEAWLNDGSYAGGLRSAGGSIGSPITKDAAFESTEYEAYSHLSFDGAVMMLLHEIIKKSRPITFGSREDFLRDEQVVSHGRHHIVLRIISNESCLSEVQDDTVVSICPSSCFGIPYHSSSIIAQDPSIQSFLSCQRSRAASQLRCT